MATIKSYTDLQQSKKLAEILPLESADMVYFGIHQGMDGKYYLSGTNTEDDVVPIYTNLCTKVFVKTTTSDIICQLPCWSLASMLGVLPLLDNRSPVISKTFDGEYRVLYHSTAYEKAIITSDYDNPVDACVAMVEKLHELNLL